MKIDKKWCRLFWIKPRRSNEHKYNVAVITKRQDTYFECNQKRVALSQANNSNSDGDDPAPEISNRQHNNDGFHNKCESLDEGTFAFMCWMNSENKKSISSDNPNSFVEIC